MEYQLTQDCRFGTKGTIVGYHVWRSATTEEKKWFKEVGATNNLSSPSSYSSSDSHQYRDDTQYPVWTDGDATSSVSSSPSNDNDLAYGGGHYGGGGASGDWGSSNDSSSSSSSGSDYSSSDYGSSDSGSSDCGSSND